MHKHTHTDRSGAGSSRQEGAEIIHDDTSRSECACFDSNGPWNGCFRQTEIDFVVDVKLSGLQGHFYPLTSKQKRSITVRYIQWVQPIQKETAGPFQASKMKFCKLRLYEYEHFLIHPIMINVSENSGQVRISSVSQQMVVNHPISFMGTFSNSVSMAVLKKKSLWRPAECEFT